MSGYIFLAVLLLSYLSFLIYKERVIFFKKNRELLSKIGHFENEATIVLDRVWCTFSKSKLVSSGFFAKIYIVKNGILIIDDYTLDLNKNKEKYASTYLICHEKKLPKIDRFLFRNWSIIKNISINEKGDVKVKVDNYQQSPFKSIGFYPSSYSFEISFSSGKSKEVLKSYL